MTNIAGSLNGGLTDERSIGGGSRKVARAGTGADARSIAGTPRAGRKRGTIDTTADRNRG